MPTPASPTAPRDAPFSRGDRLFLALLTFVALVLGLRGVLRLSYVGQDFVLHHALILLFPREALGYFLKFTNPPALYWFASLVREHVSADHYLDVVSLCFLVLNVGALWILYRFLWAGIESRGLRYSAAAFITLVPFRVIHSIVIAADAFTLPVFALAAVLAARLFANPRGILSWVGLSLCLTAGVCCKYTFFGLLPPAALILGYAIAARAGKGRRLRLCAVGALALALPSAVFLLEMRENAAQRGPLNRVWIGAGEEPQMRWSDVLLPKRADLRLLSAPEFSRDRLTEARRYSYPALLHLASVTDCMNLFQAPPGDIAAQLADVFRNPTPRERSPLSQRLQAWSVRWCLPSSAMAAAGTVLCGALALAALATRRPLLADSTIVISALAAGFYSPLFLSLARVRDAYSGAYFLPRLVMPAIAVFIGLGFVAADRACARLGRRGPAARALTALLSAHALVACALFVGFLC